MPLLTNAYHYHWCNPGANNWCGAAERLARWTEFCRQNCVDVTPEFPKKRTSAGSILLTIVFSFSDRIQPSQSGLGCGISTLPGDFALRLSPCLPNWVHCFSGLTPEPA